MIYNKSGVFSDVFVRFSLKNLSPTSLSGENQVDGLPPVCNIQVYELLLYCKLAVNRQPGFRQKDSYTWLILLRFSILLSSFFSLSAGNALESSS